MLQADYVSRCIIPKVDETILFPSLKEKKKTMRSPCYDRDIRKHGQAKEK